VSPTAKTTGKRRSRPRPAATPLFPRWVRHVLRIVIHLALDGAAVAIAYRYAYQLRFHTDAITSRLIIRGGDPGWGLYAELMYTVVPLWLFLFWYSSRIYTRPWISPYDRFLNIVKGAGLGTVLTFAATYIYSRLAYSRLMLLLAGPLAIITVGIAHLIAIWIDSLMARFEETSPLLLVGGGRVSELVRENIRARHPYAPIHELTRIPKPAELVTLAREKRARDIVLVRSDVEHGRLLELAEACETAGLQFRMIPDLLELRLGELQMDDSLGLPAYRLQHAQLTRSNYIAKRTFDVVFSLAVFAILGPPLLLIALLIRLDSKGSVLFKQKRLGFRGKVFYAYKFRTMYIDAEKRLAEVRGLNNQKGGFFKAKEDPRITAIGRTLRRFSVDEFPQFLNVFRGEMSIVGPRPLAVTTGEMEELVRRFGATAKKRLNTLPGITGLWQVSGRSDISADQRFALDMFYIERWSLGLDLEIILKTVPAMLSGKGAY
jgi:exopolysaccharide biosynthesis polyprenyl glycosylphosphotransferase